MRQEYHTPRRQTGNPDPHRCPNGPEPGILIVRDGDHYLLLHGQLRLAASLSVNDGLCVEVRGEGLVRIHMEGESLVVEQGDALLPLLRNA